MRAARRAVRALAWTAPPPPSQASRSALLPQRLPPRLDLTVASWPRRAPRPPTRAAPPRDSPPRTAARGRCCAAVDAGLAAKHPTSCPRTASREDEGGSRHRRRGGCDPGGQEARAGVPQTLLHAHRRFAQRRGRAPPSADSVSGSSGTAASPAAARRQRRQDNQRASPSGPTSVPTHQMAHPAPPLLHGRPSSAGGAGARRRVGGVVAKRAAERGHARERDAFLWLARHQTPKDGTARRRTNIQPTNGGRWGQQHTRAEPRLSCQRPRRPPPRARCSRSPRSPLQRQPWTDARRLRALLATKMSGTAAATANSSCARAAARARAPTGAAAARHAPPGARGGVTSPRAASRRGGCAAQNPRAQPRRGVRAGHWRAAPTPLQTLARRSASAQQRHALGRGGGAEASRRAQRAADSAARNERRENDESPHALQHTERRATQRRGEDVHCACKVRIFCRGCVRSVAGGGRRRRPS